MRFRLRSALVVVTAVAVAIGWFASLRAGQFLQALATLMGIGLPLAVTAGLWRNRSRAIKWRVGIVCGVGWCLFASAITWLVGQLVGPMDETDFIAEARFASLFVFVLAAPGTIVVAVLVLREWIWSYHDRFGSPPPTSE